MTDATYTTTPFAADTSSSIIPMAVAINPGAAITLMSLDTCMVGPCEVDSLYVGTGYDHINDTTHPSMAQDGLWKLIEAPTNNGPHTLGFPVFSIDKHPAWSVPGFNSTYVSAFNMPGSNATNLDTTETPYTMQSCLLYTSPSPRDRQKSRMPSSA